MGNKPLPLRMCVVCREMKSKREMIRVVKNAAGEISFDTTGKAQGRGAYICNNEACVKKGIKQKVFNKAFKCEISDEIYQKLSEDYFDER